MLAVEGDGVVDRLRLSAALASGDRDREEPAIALERLSGVQSFEGIVTERRDLVEMEK